MSEAALAVLHVALHPVTGPWSVMRSLARAQASSGRYAGVGLGVIHYADWPAEYVDDLAGFAPHAFRAATPRLFGTASFLWQRLRSPPIARWVQSMVERVDARQVAVHIHNAWLSGVFVPVRAGNVTVRTVATFHGIAGASSLARQPVRRSLHRWMAQRLADHEVALTSVDADHLHEVRPLFGLSPETFRVVPNGAPRLAAESRNGPVRSGELTIAHVGTLNADKGWRIAADAVMALRAEGVPVRLLIAGDGPDVADATECAERSRGGIEYLGYVRDPARTVLPAADVLVLMTANDGLPMAVIEALSCAVPVVATRIGGIPDAVLDGQSGRLVVRDSRALGDVLRQLHRDPDALRRLSEGALRVFLERHEMSRVVDAYDAVYRGAS